MNIVFVIDTYNESSGGSVATKRLVTELKKRGHNIKVVAAIHENESDPDFYEVPRFTIPIRRNIQSQMKFYFGKNKKSVFYKAMKDADLVQIQFPFLMAKGAAKMAKELNIPVIGSFHLQPQNILLALHSKNKNYEKLIWWLFKYFLFNRVNHVVAPSTFASNLLAFNGVKADITTISNGITNEYTHQKLKKPDWFMNHFVILSVGRHANEKKHNLIIEAIKKSNYASDIQLILAGKGELSHDLKQLGNSLPIKPVIEYISSEEKILFMNTSDIYIHASDIELESLSTAEAIGCGLPSLISNSIHSAASQFSLDDRFLFNANDVNDLAQKINYWYENRLELNSDEIRDKARSVANNYLIKDSIDKYENLYKQLTKI